MINIKTIKIIIIVLFFLSFLFLPSFLIENEKGFALNNS